MITKKARVKMSGNCVALTFDERAQTILLSPQMATNLAAELLRACRYDGVDVTIEEQQYQNNRHEFISPRHRT